MYLSKIFIEDTSMALPAIPKTNTALYASSPFRLRSDLPTVESISRSIGYTFRDPDLLKTSLNHRSMLNEGIDKQVSNERLEFLGDAVLETIVRKFLFSCFPDSSEGDLSQLKDCLVSKNTCYRYSSIIGLEKFILVSSNVPMENDKAKRTILADAFEALLGAIFLDGGYSGTERFFLDKTQSIIQELIKNPPVNWKQKLQHYLQIEYQRLPTYQVIEEQDFGYLNSFQVVVSIDEFVLGQGEGYSKKEAEQEAAEKALENLKRGLDLSKINSTSMSLEKKLPGERLGNRRLFGSQETEEVFYLDKQQSVSTLSKIRQLMILHQRITDFLKHIDLETSGLTPEEQAFLKAQQQIPLPRKKVRSALLVEGRKKLVPTAVREIVDLSPLSIRTREIFARIQSEDPCLTVHFLNETLKDRDLMILAQLLESNTILHQLYLRSLSIGELGIKALKKVLLFNKTLIRLEVQYPSSIKIPLFQMVYNALKINTNKILLDLTLCESWYSRETPPIHLIRSFGSSRFDLQPIEGHLN